MPLAGATAEVVLAAVGRTLPGGGARGANRGLGQTEVRYRVAKGARATIEAVVAQARCRGSAISGGAHPIVGARSTRRELPDTQPRDVLAELSCPALGVSATCALVVDAAVVAALDVLGAWEADAAGWQAQATDRFAELVARTVVAVVAVIAGADVAHARVVQAVVVVEAREAGRSFWKTRTRDGIAKAAAAALGVGVTGTGVERPAGVGQALLVAGTRRAIKRLGDTQPSQVFTKVERGAVAIGCAAAREVDAGTGLTLVVFGAWEAYGA